MRYLHKPRITLTKYWALVHSWLDMLNLGFVVTVIGIPFIGFHVHGNGLSFALLGVELSVEWASYALSASERRNVD